MTVVGLAAGAYEERIGIGRLRFPCEQALTRMIIRTLHQNLNYP